MDPESQIRDSRSLFTLHHMIAIATQLDHDLTVREMHRGALDRIAQPRRVDRTPAR